MRFFILLLIAGTLLFSATKFEEGYLVYKTGDFKSALKMFQTLAEEENDSDAAYLLGYMYEHGEGCTIDKKEADRWYKISSKGYYLRAQDDTSRDINKEKRKLYENLEKPLDKETQTTLRRYAQSLYNIKAHNANYFLPISYRTNGQYEQTNGHNAQDIETEFQLSIKYDFAANILDLSEVYTFAYTQLSFWQLYETSAYFRETNYNPEFFVTFPISEFNDAQLVRAVRLSFAHQSNGRGGREERSWNYLSASTYFQYKLLFTELKLWYRVNITTDYNPELIDYMGYGHIKFTLPYKKHMAKLLVRNNFSGEYAVELNYSYPAFGRDDLFFYVKGFSGYGESLIDFDNRIDKIGFGFSISR